ncbi:MAG: Uma2 family endonuclease [Acidimicrobiales bacterium]
MRTVVLGPRPAELEALIARRRALGLDTFDEVWEGEYHMSPAPHPRHAFLAVVMARVLGPRADVRGVIALGPCNIGEPDNFRVPDASVHRSMPDTVFIPTAALVVEIVSPDDETWAKLGFYAAHGVEEVLIVDPATRAVTWLALTAAGDGYVETDHSAVLDVAAADLAAEIDWPTV